MAQARTLTYAEDVQGWPSFYSYLADYMIGMNGFFYTWSGGNLYRHNTNNTRNNYYGQQYNSTITGVLNIEPKTIKLFKTMSYESDDAWACTNLFTDLGDGSMLSTYFQQKEGEWFTFLRENSTTRDYKDRNVNGIGEASNVTGPANAVVITFPASVPVGTIISAGDYIYFGTVPTYVGQIDPLVGVVDFVNNSITVDTTVPEPATGNGGTAPNIGDFIFYFKDVVAESHGARGYFMQFTLQNTNTQAVELFAVGSSVMKSFP